MDYTVENTGYSEHQEVVGYMELEVEGLDEPVYIDVSEVTSSMGFDVYMTLNFVTQSDEHKKKVLELIEAKKRFDDDEDEYQITDDNFISELFGQYGNNA